MRLKKITLIISNIYIYVCTCICIYNTFFIKSFGRLVFWRLAALDNKSIASAFFAALESKQNTDFLIVLSTNKMLPCICARLPLIFYETPWKKTTNKIHQFLAFIVCFWQHFYNLTSQKRDYVFFINASRKLYEYSIIIGILLHWLCDIFFFHLAIYEESNFFGSKALLVKTLHISQGAEGEFE